MARKTNIMPALLFTLLPFLIGMIISCSSKPSTSYHVVRISGNCENIANLTTSGISSVFFAGNSTVTAVLMKEGDFIQFDDFLHYRGDADKSDYHVIVNDSILYLNESISSIMISKDYNILSLLSQMDSSTMASLRSLNFAGEIPDEYMPYIKKLASGNAQIGLFFQEINQNTRIILDLFNPIWIGFEDLKQSDFDLLSKLDHAELLYISFTDSVISNPLPGLSGLKQLVLSGIDEKDVLTERLLINNSQIETMTFLMTANSDYSFMQGLENLRVLTLTNLDAIPDIEFIRQYEELEELGLICELEKEDINILTDIPLLKRLVLPYNTSQTDFDSIIEYHEKLEIIELPGCENISDLNVLTQLSGLYGLIVVDTLSEFASIHLMENLKYLSLPEDVFEDSTYIGELKNSLPETIIVPNRFGFCLGSGWLLLFFPLVAFFTFLRRNHARLKPS